MFPRQRLMVQIPHLSFSLRKVAPLQCRHDSMTGLINKMWWFTFLDKQLNV